MRFAALATDFDETLADHGRVLPGTERALERLRASGRKLLLLTGRVLGDLLHIFRRIDLFHAVVAENGALLYLPDRKQERPLAESPPEQFAAALGRAGVPGAIMKRQRAAWSSFAESERSCSNCDAAR
jgi:HAD superfamily hydrolase (TIGR01484 family)